MPKSAAYRLIWRSERGVYELWESHSGQALPVPPGSHAWFAWLATIPSFAFSGQQGRLTVRQERRPRGGTYWYAYRRDGDRLAKRYLGRTTALVPAHLEEVAAQLVVSRPEHAASTSERTAHALPPLRGPATSISEDVTGGTLLPALAGGWNDQGFATKLRVPHLRTQLVRRPNLLSLLQQGMDATLVLVSAPAGFGKTTVLAQWLVESGMPAAWLSLEPEDNEPVRFLSAMIAALQQLHPQIGTAALALLHTPPPTPLPTPETVLALLTSDVQEFLPGNVALILDDYHVITDASLQRALTALVEHAPPHLHLVIATRADPPWPLARLRARGQLCEVQATHLQFRTEETSDFLHSVMGLPLSAEAIATLESRTEGWITGLQLAALSLQGRSDVTQFLEEFTGSHRHLVDYLTEEVLARQPEAVQSFLLRTSLLDRFTGPLCDTVTGRNDGEAMLASLERANLFLAPLDERREWYRYHQLFAEMLRARMCRLIGPEELSALYARASLWYERHGAPFEAVEAALEAGDFARAEGLIEPLVLSMLLSWRHTTLRRWLERLSQERLCRHAFLCFAYASSLFFSDTQDAYEGPLAVAERLAQATGDRKGLGQVSGLRALAASVRGNGAQIITFGTQALHLLPEKALLERSISMSALAYGYQLCGEVAAAQQVLSEARSLHERSGNAPSILNDTIVLGDLLVMQGKLHQAESVYGSVLQATGEWHTLAISVRLGLSSIAYERNELDTAETYLEQATTIANTAGRQVFQAREQAGEARAALMRARVFQARGEVERTTAAWTRSHALAAQCSVSGLVEQVQAYQVRGWLRAGQLEAVIQWQNGCSLSCDTAPTYEQEAIALTLARVLLAQGEAEEALRLLERWYQHARAQGRTGSEIELLVLSALAYQQQGKTEQAVQRLVPALVLGYPEGYVRLFVDEGTSMAPLLRLTLSRWKSQPEARYLHTLLAVLEAAQPGQTPLSQTFHHADPPLEPFSRRERQVLRLLATGLSNTEIADELVVSINTVRTHIRSLYHKLKVNSRKEALSVARQWKLL
jgi:ATP/maltotriose-dependent transcriptional regulator MalT